jgi:hypothetical protein
VKYGKFEGSGFIVLEVQFVRVFFQRTGNNIKNSIGYWAVFLTNTRDCIPAFKCIEPLDQPHTCCSLTFKKPEPDLLFEISNFHRPGPVVE